MRGTLINFFRVDSKESMVRLLAFLCGVSATIVSIAAIVMAIRESLTYEYIALVVSLWSATFGGKNWAKNVELKRGNSNAEG